MSDARFMRLALQLAQRGLGTTSPNPMVGAVLVKGGRVIGRGWHQKAGQPHAEVEALRDAQQRGHPTRGATLFVTLEPCCTHGRTPPCTSAILAAGIKRVVVGTRDPNPRHAGKGLSILRRAGIEVVLLADPHSNGPDQSKAQLLALSHACARLNEAFNHWIVQRTPFVTVKAAMTLDGKIATATGESKWITGAHARAQAMRLRHSSDAILVGINTVLLDDPSLTVRTNGLAMLRNTVDRKPGLRRIVLDSMARTPLTARVVSDDAAPLTTIVVTRAAPQSRVLALAQRVNVLVAPAARPSMRKGPRCTPNLHWLLEKLGSENVTSLLVEGGGEVNASFLLGGLAQRVAFFYAPKILGGRKARRAVAGDGATSTAGMPHLFGVEWRRFGPDILMTALVKPPST